MSDPRLSIVIPTCNRPQLLLEAVHSALAQTVTDIEVVVVDDASTHPPQLPDDPRLQYVRLDQSRGGAGARNVGTQKARGRSIAYLDDDDILLPNMAEVSLEAIANSVLPPPVAVISGMELFDRHDVVLQTRTPPAVREKGSHFSLEDLEAGCSYNTKQTLVVERSVIQQIGGWDETFKSRVHTELFFRLNMACSIVGIPIVTYRLRQHDRYRVSRDPKLRQESFKKLVTKHKTLFRAHPKRYAKFVFEHAQKLQKMGQTGDAVASLLWAMQIDPQQTVSNTYRVLRSRLLPSNA